LNPNSKGAQDPRAQSFLHLVQNVLPALAASDEHPTRILVENVAGFEDSSIRQTLVSTTRSVGYTTLELLLTPLQFGVPNSRLRYYFLAKKEPLQFQDVGTRERDEIFRHIPGHGLAWSDPRLENQPSLSEPDVDHTILDYLDDLGEGYLEYAVPDKVLEKWGRLFDIVKPSTNRTCCFTRGYTQLVERAGSILQENEDLDTTAVFNEFLEAQAREDADAVKIVHPLRLRYFSPSELLRLFAFDPPRRESLESTFVWPDSTSKKSKYKLIGNSINVKVVQTLIEYLFKEPE
jgi:tRNA (cytosine38-C5)-methyltransferase